jgi:hypothetical protein
LSARALKVSFVVIEKILFPEKSLRMEVIAALSKTGSGVSIISILSGFKKNIGVAKRTKIPTESIQPRKTQPTVLK